MIFVIVLFHFIVLTIATANAFACQALQGKVSSALAASWQNMYKTCTKESDQIIEGIPKDILGTYYR